MSLGVFFSSNPNRVNQRGEAIRLWGLRMLIVGMSCPSIADPAADA